MRRTIGMRYKKIKKNNELANEEANLVTRHMFARKMFELEPGAARVFNVDESWFSDFSWNSK